MNIKQVNEIFKTKYPNGEVLGKGMAGLVGTKTKICVTFDNTKGKVKTYGYYVANYVELLEKLGFDIMYKRDYDLDKKRYQERISEIEEELKSGIIKDEFFGDYELPEHVRKSDEEDLEELKELLIELDEKILV